MLDSTSTTTAKDKTMKKMMFVTIGLLGAFALSAPTFTAVPVNAATTAKTTQSTTTNNKMPVHHKHHAVHHHCNPTASHKCPAPKRG